MDGSQEFITTLTGQLLSWPVATLVVVLTLRGSIRNLLQRVSEAEGFGVKASFQELQEAVDKVELRAEIAATNGASEPVEVKRDTEKGGPVGPDADAASLRLRSALDEARVNPRASVRTARGQLIARVTMWHLRINPGGGLWAFDDQLNGLERGGWISSDLKSAISTALKLGRKQILSVRSINESQAVSYLTLITRLEHVLEREIRPQWNRHKTSVKK